MISVAEALAKVLEGVGPIERIETVRTEDADGRILAETLHAGRDQPPFRASAMDGYAVRAEDVRVGTPLELIGESKAGQRFGGALGAGETVRIFTGAPLPDGADAILIQENAHRDGTTVRPTEAVSAGRYVRPAGGDFARGAMLLETGSALGAGAIVLLASANVARVRVLARPKVAIIATGDELVPLGTVPDVDQIVASSILGVAAILRGAGAETIDCGIARDNAHSLDAALDRATDAGADVVVTLGGASVGDHDLVRPVFERRAVRWTFERIAMRPGKPLMHGRDRERVYLGLPGNPVSSLVCAIVFGVPLLAALQGRVSTLTWTPAVLGADLPTNDRREEFMRVRVEQAGHGPVAYPFDSQDSSLVTRFALADALLHRPANAPASAAGDPCEVTFLRTTRDSPLRAIGDAG